MTASTTLKLPEQLKARVVKAAAGAGKSPHAFMVEAIDLQTQLAERRREFIASASWRNRKWRSLASSMMATKC